MATNVMEFQAFAEALALGLTDVYELSLKQLPRTYPAFLKEDRAKRWYDTDWAVSGLGVMPEKSIGASISTDRLIKADEKQYALVAYALGIVIEYELMRWEIYGNFDIKTLSKELANSSVVRYNLVGHAFLNNSFVSTDTNYTIYNGEAMISTSHVRLDGGTWSNRLADNDGLSYVAIQKAKILLRKTVNERGIFLDDMSPRLLITSVENAWIGEEITGSSTRNDQTNPGVVNLLKNGMGAYSSPYLTTPQYWWLQTDKSKIKMKMRLGDDPEMSKDTDVRTRNLVLTSYCSFGAAVYHSYGLVGSSGGA